MKNIRKTVTTMVATAVLAVTAGACSAPTTVTLVGEAESLSTTAGLVIDGETVADSDLFAKAKAEGSLSLYSGYVENSEKEVIKAFTQDTGIKVNLVRLVPNRLLERVLSEQGANKLGADVIRTSEYSSVSAMNEAGAFTPYKVPNFDQLDETVAYENGSFYRVFDPAFTFAYNTALVSEADAPKSWQDLLDPKWKGKIGTTQVGAGGSSASLVRFQLDALGEDYLRGYAAQQPRIFDSSGAQQESLSRGEILVATAVVSSVNIASSNNAPVKFVVPEEGFALYDYFLGMTPEAQHPAAAQVFMNWNLSKRGASVFSQIGEYPADSNAPPPVVMDIQLPAIDTGLPRRGMPEDLARYGKDDQAIWNEIFGYIG
ncbi:ABC transporter substrate-binding protein [Arthrobacter sp. 08Y14]|uniref:ABC transporter substrate-binding protein n=1 Tax=Arthrobacter sp. 08Y14 TaxID=2058885 RepID=UPI000CE4913B|nr:ABC transporter substrate-binding protein [Arthrobacter sp. 08Y14]